MGLERPPGIGIDQGKSPERLGLAHSNSASGNGADALSLERRALGQTGFM
jgi:hypothetical protein